ncbi:hypothetical protein [Myxococcus sp. RHSTA-1-4]|uniref:hypothetical protein n=1 Tax=Myxococcus sp. RHSTA-1-4 TaxID=2874601 RepID=UPI001CC13B5E|nr:hypothetical protein [Myxococcus sp. RHSTA-1-4]MBZ4422654.1 hypothetical protein [Myxococcus sp. RHSTA-1-4]
MTHLGSRRWSIAAAAGSCLLLMGCDETEGLYRTVTVDSEVAEACIHTALEAVPGATLSGDGTRWSVRLPGNADATLDPSVVLTRKGSLMKLEVFVGRIVPGRGRYTADELAAAEDATERLMRAVTLACVPSDKVLSSSCEVKARARQSGECQREGAR